MPAGGNPTTYDRLPYLSHAFPQTHPDRLAAIGRVFRLTPPDLRTCRVLELGCASGGNLVPMAFQLPDAEFVGLDLSARQVDDGRSAIDALALGNVRIELGSIMDVDDSWGRFDYIICHGVFSWVERPVQDRILAIAAAQLTAHGIAYVSYNTYPGWHQRAMVREMMRYHARQFDDPAAQVEQARALLTFLASATPGDGSYAQLLTAEAERLASAPDAYVYHEHLERTNLPLFFHEFMARAESAGLQFLSESSLAEMLTARFPPDVAETLERISPDLLHLEQYMDFVRNRQFRQTLLCREVAQPVRALSASALGGLLVSSAGPADAVDLEDGKTAVFSNGAQRAEVSRPLTKAALSLLAEAWPRAIDVGELSASALRRAAPFLGGTPDSEARERMLEDLFGAVVYGLVRPHTIGPACVSAPGDTPRAYPVAAVQARSGSIVVNVHHEMVQLDTLALEVLQLADGRRSRDAILGWLQSVRMDENAAGEGGAGDAIPAEGLPAAVDEALARLARHALLV